MSIPCGFLSEQFQGSALTQLISAFLAAHALQTSIDILILFPFCELVRSLAAGMLVTILLDLWRISIGGITDVSGSSSSDGLPWM